MSFLAARLYVTLKTIFRSKTSLFWTILFPLIMTTMFIGVFTGSARPPGVRLGVVNLDENSSVVAGLLRGLEASPAITKIVFYDNVTQLVNALLSPPPTPVSAGLVIPRGFTRNVTSGLQARLEVYLVYTGDPWGNYTGYTLLSTLSRIEDVFREYRIRVSLRFVPQEYRGYLVSLVFPLNVSVETLKPPRLFSTGSLKAWYAVSVALVEALFIGLFASATWLVSEARRGTLRYMLSTPARGYEYVLSVMLDAIVATSIASIVALTAGYLMGTEYTIGPGAWALFAALIVLSTLFSASIGALICFIVDRPESATAAANAVGFPLMFIGGIVYPPWLLPGPLRTFAKLFPLSRLAEAARAVIVYGMDPGKALARYTPPQVLTATIVFIVAASLLYRRRLQAVLEGGWAA